MQFGQSILSVCETHLTFFSLNAMIMQENVGKKSVTSFHQFFYWLWSNTHEPIVELKAFWWFRSWWVKAFVFVPTLFQADSLRGTRSTGQWCFGSNRGEWISTALAIIITERGLIDMDYGVMSIQSVSKNQSNRYKAEII